MQKSSINPEIAHEMLSSAANAADKGQSQFFTPPEFGRACAKHLHRNRPVIVDLNCGAGHLLQASANVTTSNLLGVDIDPCNLQHDHSVKAQIVKTTHDLTLNYALLKEVKFRADCFVLNPPWGLEWHAERLAALAESELPAVRMAFKNGVTGWTSSKGTIDSTIATLLIALDLCTTPGEGFLIANNATIERLIFAPGAPFAAIGQHIWAHVVLPGNPMTGLLDAKWVKDEQFNTAVLYFARDHTKGPRRHSNLDSLDRLHRQGAELYAGVHTAAPDLWSAVRGHVREQQELARRNRPVYNLWLHSNGLIGTYLSEFSKLSTKTDKREAERLFKLDGQSPMQLVLQRAQRDDLVHVSRKAGWSVDPKLLAAVEAALLDYESARAPLYPLPEIQRLGYLDEQDRIECKEDLLDADGDLVFKQGQTYPIRSLTVNLTRTATKPNSMTGEDEDIEYTGQELALLISRRDIIPPDKGEEYCFMSGSLRAPDVKITDPRHSTRSYPDCCPIDFTLEDICRHFVIPEVPDVAKCQPELYEQYVAKLSELMNLTGLKLKKFQHQDLSRAALKDGLILSWDTGLGKSWALFLWALIKVGWTTSPPGLHGGRALAPNGPVLLLAPGDLHQQIMKEGKRFKVNVTLLDHQDTFTRLCGRQSDGRIAVNQDGRPVIPAGFYITSYSQLCQNGIIPFPDPASLKDPTALMQPYAISTERHIVPIFDTRGLHNLWGDHYDLLGIHHEADRDIWKRVVRRDLDAAYEAKLRALENETSDWARIRRSQLEASYDLLCNLVPVSRKGPHVMFTDLDVNQQRWFNREALIRIFQGYQDGLGQHRAYDPVTGKLVEEEEHVGAVRRIKCISSPSLSDLSYNAFDAVCIDEGVKMKGEESLIGMGVRQMAPAYRLVCTATPIKNRLTDIFRLAWWAAGGRPTAHARFPYNDSSEDRSQFGKQFLVSERNTSKSARTKATAEVCNVHRLWKLFGPLILRRRKQDCGEDIVPRIRNIIRCKMGTEQRRVVQYHLKAEYLDKNDLPALGAQLQALRTAAADPSSDLLKPVGEGVLDDDGEPLPHRSAHTFIPKISVTLNLIQEILARGEQVVVGSAFNHPLDNLSNCLREAGVRHAVLDGRVNQKKRGVMSELFQKGRFAPVAAVCDRRISNLKSEISNPALPVPVMLAGVECMAEGHNWYLARNIILVSYSWAFDKFKQFFDRIHRMTSPFPVNIYVVLCDGTIDARLEQLTNEKSDSAELVLDGRLIGERSEEVNFAQLLREAGRAFNSEDDTMDESMLHREWPALRAALSSAMQGWDLPPVVSAVCDRRSEISNLKSAIKSPRPTRMLSLPVFRAPTVQTPAIITPLAESSWRIRVRERALRQAQLIAA